MIKWQIWIDTGGTFTDCIAINPAGELLRAKVLSSSCLRANILKKIAPLQFHFAHKWNIQKDIFRNYTLRSLEDHAWETSIEQIDFQNNILHLNKDLPFSKPFSFEISAKEEAPILGARILTETPLAQGLPVIDMRLGSTKGTNALLEKKGAEVTFLVTKGFKDLIRIGTQQRPNLFQLDIPDPNVIYQEVIEVAERISAKGEILHAIEPSEIERIILALKKKKTVIAIAFLHSYLNPIHELQIQAALKAADVPFISLSHELSPSIKILPRAKTALVNAYLAPILSEYLTNIKNSLAAESELRVMTSAGGLVRAGHFHPKDSLLSGPAGGIVGAAKVANLLGFQKILTLDMGGTSTDTARYDERFDYDFTTKIDDIEMSSPALAIETVAAGGGSICYFDGYKLCVGPESAGANPGPACYGAGGPLAITDVNLLLGKLDPTAMGIPVEQAKAEAAIKKVRTEIFQKTGTTYSEQELLEGFEKIANEKMADAIRKISIAKGLDTKDYALVVFGGAGGLHACKIADLLDVSTVILPFDGGLLSAYGIGNAQIERMVEQQVLEELEVVQPKLLELLKALSQKAMDNLEKEGFLKNEIEVKTRLLYLRFKGQDSSLEIELPKEHFQLEYLEAIFEKKYKHLFGHFPSAGKIELESIKIIVANKQTEAPTSAVAGKTSFLQNLKKEKNNTALVHWKELKVGAQIEAPTILLNPNSTAFLENGWSAEVKAGQNIVLKKTSQNEKKTAQLKAAIELELFTNRFTSIAEEMGAQLQRTAFSVNIKERLDFSCAILDAEAELLVNAPHIPVHLGSLGICARLVKEKIKLEKGDVVITNHPKYGGSHLPDVTMMSAVYTAKGDLIGYVINRAHHAEIGGKRPGSMPPDAKCLEEEGVVFAPTYLMKNGVANWETIEEILIGSPYPTRALHENLADINAALASLKTGEEKLITLAENHGLKKVHEYMSKLKKRSFETLQLALQNFKNQKFEAIEKLDDGHQIQVKIEVKEENIIIDFEGTSAVHPFNLNANISIVYSAVIYVLRLLCEKEIPLNEGLMQQVKIHLPAGSFLHPNFEDNPAKCPAVVGGNTEVSQRLVDTLLKAFGLAACSQGTMNNFLFGNENFGYYETIGGGTGAGNGFHGQSGVHQHMTNTKITDPEELEFRYPVLLHEFGIRENSGGKGKWRGGDGIVRSIEFLAPVDLTIISQHRKEHPYGKESGDAGKNGQQIIIRKDGHKEILKGVDSCQMKKGDKIIIETPGGGGWGKGN